MIEVDVSSAILPSHRLVFESLRSLTMKIGADGWALVGGLMVLVIAAEHGATGKRSEGTKDGDVVVDVLTRPEMLQRTTWSLHEMGFSLEDRIGGSGAGGARCTYVFGSAVIDVLCPDGTPPEMLSTSDGAASVAMPGGRMAITHSRMVEVIFDRDQPAAQVMVPTIVGALLTKAAAVLDERTRGQMRHLQDVAFLLSILTDPKKAGQELDADARRMVESVPDVRDDQKRSPAWEYLTPAERRTAASAYRLLLGLPST